MDIQMGPGHAQESGDSPPKVPSLSWTQETSDSDFESDQPNLDVAKLKLQQSC